MYIRTQSALAVGVSAVCKNILGGLIMGDFGDAERRIKGLMSEGTVFKFQGRQYKIIMSDKPTCSKGEPKTDIYILAENDKSETIEIKISYKKENADFIENKMSAERAEQLFGSEWEVVIENSTTAIKDRFAERMLIYRNRFKRTNKGAITLGWKFELMNKNSGDLSGKMILTEEQVIDVYAGNNLSDDKRNASICGNIIPDSGVANYIFLYRYHFVNNFLSRFYTFIHQYVRNHPEIYFACKALNYRTFEEKWDGNRPLSVQVDWSAENGKLVPELVFDRPLQVKGNEVAERLIMYMNKLHIKNTDDINDNNAGTDRIV